MVPSDRVSFAENQTIVNYLVNYIGNESSAEQYRLIWLTKVSLQNSKACSCLI